MATFIQELKKIILIFCMVNITIFEECLFRSFNVVAELPRFQLTLVLAWPRGRK